MVTDGGAIVKYQELNNIAVGAAYRPVIKNCSNTDFNELREPGFYMGYTNMANAAFQTICTLEVIYYSDDWLLQRQTNIASNTTYTRTFYSGSTWSPWVRLAYETDIPTFSYSNGTLTITM